MDLKSIYLSSEYLLGRKESTAYIIGYFSGFVPVELLEAGGVHPVKLFPNQDQSVNHSGRQTLLNFLCPYVVGIHERLQSGQLDFLDGIVGVHACDAQVKMLDIWKMEPRIKFSYFINYPPRKIDETSRRFVLNEFKRFVSWLEDITGNHISEEDINEAAMVRVKNRRLLSKLNGLRKTNPKFISGSQMFFLYLLGHIMSQKEFGELLQETLGFVEKERLSQSRRNQQPRILIAGNILDFANIIELAEELGADVVCEDVEESRTFSSSVTPPPGLEGLVMHYLQREQEAFQHPLGTRYPYIEALCNEYQIDGVIYHTPTFCDTHKLEQPYIVARLQQLGIPTLILEGDGTASAQYRSRIEAFLEILDTKQAKQ